MTAFREECTGFVNKIYAFVFISIRCLINFNFVVDVYVEVQYDL
jgi:hypothetical protein